MARLLVSALLSFMLLLIAVPAALGAPLVGEVVLDATNRTETGTFTNIQPDSHGFPSTSMVMQQPRDSVGAPSRLVKGKITEFPTLPDITMTSSDISSVAALTKPNKVRRLPEETQTPLSGIIWRCGVHGMFCKTGGDPDESALITPSISPTAVPSNVIKVPRTTVDSTLSGIVWWCGVHGMHCKNMGPTTATTSYSIAAEAEQTVTISIT